MNWVPRLPLEVPLQRLAENVGSRARAWRHCTLGGTRSLGETNSFPCFAAFLFPSFCGSPILGPGSHLVPDPTGRPPGPSKTQGNCCPPFPSPRGEAPNHCPGLGRVKGSNKGPGCPVAVQLSPGKAGWWPGQQAGHSPCVLPIQALEHRVLWQRCWLMIPAEM